MQDATVALFDQSEDGDQDVVLGDISYNTIVYGNNGGDSSSATIDAVDTIFPRYDRKVNIPVFPGSFFADVRVSDGRDDLLFAPNSIGSSVDMGNVWYYHGTGPLTDKQFNFVTDSFLVGDMIEVGQASHPIFFDANGDSLMDIIVANDGYYQPQQRIVGVGYVFVSKCRGTGYPEVCIENL
jgi:hypothetical protein